MGLWLLSRGKDSSGDDQIARRKSLPEIAIRKDERRVKYDSIRHKNDWDGLVMSTEVVRGNKGSDDGRDYPVNAIKINNTFDVI